MTGPENRLLRYRQALLPASPRPDPDACLLALETGGASFLDLVVSQDLGPLWHHVLEAHALLDSLPATTAATLHEARIAAAMSYMAHRAALDRIDALFDGAGVPYAAMKGSHVRECVYPDPALRPSCDIDLLILPEDRRRAAAILIEAGFEPRPKAVSISHEASFTRGIVDIDLHWNILRPGRTRVDFTQELIARRQRTRNLWGLSNDDTLFLMLTHPAFAKYVSSPSMGLARVADFLLWIRTRPADWGKVLEMLQRAGLKTAAWTLLSWFRMLAAPDAVAIIDGWIGSVRPGALRAAYLRQWLERDLPSRWLDRLFVIRFGFTLPLHDRPGDVLHALSGLRQARQNQLRDARLLLGDDFVPERFVPSENGV